MYKLNVGLVVESVSQSVNRSEKHLSNLPIIFDSPQRLSTVRIREKGLVCVQIGINATDHLDARLVTIQGDRTDLPVEFDRIQLSVHPDHLRYPAVEHLVNFFHFRSAEDLK